MLSTQLHLQKMALWRCKAVPRVGLSIPCRQNLSARLEAQVVSGRVGTVHQAPEKILAPSANAVTWSLKLSV